MSLLDDIQTYEKTNKTKKQLLLEVKTEIQKMMDIQMPIKKQIELLIKNDIVKKLTISEYTNILKNYFGYKTKSNKKEDIQKVEPQKEFEVKKEVRKTKITPNKKPSDILSQDIDLMAFQK